jgi:hypothetical protein
MRLTGIIAVVCLCWAVAGESRAPSSTSESLARQVSELMQARGLDGLAAQDPDAPDRFVAALHVPPQLLVVSARYEAPSLLRERLHKREYREVYLSLQGAGKRDGRFFVQDLGGDGLQPSADDNRPFDIIYESATIRTAFDGDWRAQKLSEKEYHDRFTAADARYARLLKALLAQAQAEATAR